MIIFAFVLPFFRQTQTYGGPLEWIITILFVEPFAEGQIEKKQPSMPGELTKKTILGIF